MQIEIYNPAQGTPLPPIQWNYEEVKAWVQNGLADYKNRVYTDANIADAKKDRAALNKLAYAIDTKRKEMKALYLEPYTQFEAEAKELVTMIKEVNEEIDAQVKASDERRKKDKEAAIREVYETIIGDLAGLIPYERLHNPKWLNVTTSMQTITDEMGAKIVKITSGLIAIDKLEMDPDIVAQVKDVFLKGFDLAEALTEKDRLIYQKQELARLKAAQEAQRIPEPEPVKPAEIKAAPVQQPAAGEKLYTVAFKVEATSEQLTALRAFLKANGIKYGRA